MGVADNTLVMFASDNGASAEQINRGDRHAPGATPGAANSFLGLGPGWSTMCNTPFRLHKSWVHEGGCATPLIVHWPRGIAARGELRRTPGHFVDFVPTFLEVTGVKSPARWGDAQRPELSGVSLVPAFAKDATLPRAPIFFSHIGNRGLRTGDWKLVAAGKDGPWELYNMSPDRSETHDLASSQPEKLKELVAEWTRLDELYRKQGSAGESLKGKKKSAQ